MATEGFYIRDSVPPDDISDPVAFKTFILTRTDPPVLYYWDGSDYQELSGGGGGGGGGAPTDANYLVGTANGDLSAEIVVGASPGGELGGTWESPTVDATHSGSSHAAAQAAAEATAAAALSAHASDTTSIHGITDTSALETTTGAQAKVDAHVNDASAAHAASAIAVAPFGSIAATDVQAALEEIVSEATGGTDDQTAGEVPYTPSVGADWGTDPDDVAEALDQLAERVADIEGTGTTDGNAIHDNVAGEFAAITQKATPVSGDLLLIEDSADGNNKKYIEIGDLPGGGGGGSGSDAWRAFGLATDLVPPPTSSWTWDNQGSATRTDADDAIKLASPKDADSSTILRGIFRTAPATPYTVTALLLSNFLPTVSANQITQLQIAFRQSSDGKLDTFGVSQGSSTSPFVAIRRQHWNSSSSFASSIVATNVPCRPELAWLRITDDGTNRICALSFDGITYNDVHSEGRTTFLTADQIGVYIRGSAGVTGLNLLSWNIT